MNKNYEDFKLKNTHYLECEGNKNVLVGDDYIVRIIKESKIEEATSKDVEKEILKYTKLDDKKDFILKKADIEKLATKYKIDTETIYQFGDKLKNGDWEFGGLGTLAKGILEGDF